MITHLYLFNYYNLKLNYLVGKVGFTAARYSTNACFPSVTVITAIGRETLTCRVSVNEVGPAVKSSLANLFISAAIAFPSNEPARVAANANASIADAPVISPPVAAS